MKPQARRTLSLAAGIMLAAITITFSGCGSKNSTAPPPGPKATVSGVVQNSAGGTPIAGASVKASSGAAATTDLIGRFSLSIAADQRVRIDVTKASFSLNQVVVQLGAGQTKSFVVGLLDAGTTASVTPSAGGTVTDAGSNAVLKLPANFVTASGPVSVTVTGLDPTSDQITALPGGLDALDGNGQPVYLSPVSFAEYTVKDAAGNVLQFNPSASQGADIELPIPASLQGQPGYQNGDPIECYVYDPADGKWKTPVPGIIGPSTVNGDPAIKATIFHLSWYGGAPASSDIGCVEGIVTLNGNPLANVDVEAFPGGNTTTNAQGHYQVQAALNSEVKVVATQFLGSTFRMAEGTVHVGASATPCANLDLALGDVQTGSYNVAALMLSEDVGTVIDFATVYIYLEAGSQQVGVDGATVQIGTGSTWFTLTPSTGGYYAVSTGTQGFTLTPGALYNLRADFTADGSWDATGSVRMVGRPAITTPAANAVVPASFTATWTDAGTSTGGYSAFYFGQIALGDTDATNFFVTSSLSRVIGNGVPDPVYQFPNDPLVAGDYTMMMYSANGPYWYFLADTSYTPNVTGTNATGYFSTIGVGNSVAFSSSGGAAPARRAAAFMQKPWKVPAWAEAQLRRAVAKRAAHRATPVSALRR